MLILELSLAHTGSRSSTSSVSRTRLFLVLSWFTSCLLLNRFDRDPLSHVFKFGGLIHLYHRLPVDDFRTDIVLSPGVWRFVLSFAWAIYHRRNRKPEVLAMEGVLALPCSKELCQIIMHYCSFAKVSFGLSLTSSSIESFNVVGLFVLFLNCLLFMGFRLREPLCWFVGSCVGICEIASQCNRFG